MSTLKKTISILLSALMIFSACLVPAFAASALTPVVYLEGDKLVYYTNEDGERVGLFEDGDYMNDFVSAALPLIPKALVTGDWDEYADAALDVFLPAFEKIAPNPDGTLPEGTGIDWSWSPATLRPDEYWSGRRPVYRYQPDSRLSPLVIADDVNDFIETVKAKTGSSKVILLGRCEGCNLVTTYLYKYARLNDYAGVQSVLFVDGCTMGASNADALLTGNVVVPADAAYRFVQFIEQGGDSFSGGLDGLTSNEQLMSYLYMIVEMLHETYGMNITSELLGILYKNLKDNFLAKFMKAWYGICLSFVACVREHYDQYVSYIFNEEGDTEKYANIIALADQFNEEIGSRVEEIVLDAKANGVSVNAIVEYGGQVYPLSEDSELIGDTFLTVEKQSFGATTAKVTKTLSDSYIKQRTDKGYGDYISPDKQIDASTGLLPDNTWYIKNMIHEFPGAVSRLANEIISTSGANVQTLSNHQFLNYTPTSEWDGTLSPLQEVNDNDIVWETEYTGKGTKSFIEMIIDYIKGLIKQIRDFVVQFTGKE